MGDEPLLREEEDSVPLLVDPDGIGSFIDGVGDEKQGTEFVEIPKPSEAEPGLRFSPLVAENGLTDSGQNDILVLPRPL